MTVTQRIVADDEADIRLDRWLRRHFPSLTQGVLQKLCRTGQVRVDGKRVETATRLAPGQSVRMLGGGFGTVPGLLLVDGVATDDNDVFLFGGRRVYRWAGGGRRGLHRGARRCFAWFRMEWAATGWGQGAGRLGAARVPRSGEAGARCRRPPPPFHTTAVPRRCALAFALTPRPPAPLPFQKPVC